MLEPFLNYFRRQAAVTDDLFELCYFSAFEALPAAIQTDGEAFWKAYFLARHPELAWYTHLCLLKNQKDDPFLGAGLTWHKGRMPSGREFMVLEYPHPDTIELEVDDFLAGRRLDQADGKLLPYFSAVLRTTTSKPASCFCLSQAPVEGLTTLRRCRLAAHYNLGRGPEPQLDRFLEWLDEVEGIPPLGVSVRFPDYVDATDRALIEQVESESPKGVEGGRKD